MGDTMVATTDFSNSFVASSAQGCSPDTVVSFDGCCHLQWLPVIVRFWAQQIKHAICQPSNPSSVMSFQVIETLMLVSLNAVLICIHPTIAVCGDAWLSDCDCVVVKKYGQGLRHCRHMTL